MRANHDFTKGDCLGMSLKVKIAVVRLTVSFLESDYLGMSLKVKMDTNF